MLIIEKQLNHRKAKTARTAATSVRGHLAYLGFTFKKGKFTNLYVIDLVEMEL